MTLPVCPRFEPDSVRKTSAKRRGKAFSGFKAHLPVDEGSGLVRRALLTPANVNKSVVAEVLPIGDEAMTADIEGEKADFVTEYYGGARSIR